MLETHNLGNWEENRSFLRQRMNNKNTIRGLDTWTNVIVEEIYKKIIWDTAEYSKWKELDININFTTNFVTPDTGT